MSWRAAGISYIAYVNMAGSMVRKCIKPEISSKIKTWKDRDSVLFVQQKFTEGKGSPKVRTNIGEITKKA